MKRARFRLEKTPILVIAFVILVLGAQLYSPIQRSTLQRELEELKQRGLTYRFLDNNTVETRDERSGFTRVKTLTEPSEMDIRKWALARGIPIIEFDAANIDTQQFAGWYRQWIQLPVFNYYFPPVTEDFDRNGKPEIYGTSRGVLVDTARIYEIDSTARVVLRYTYPPQTGGCVGESHVNRNGLRDIAWGYGTGYTYGFFEQNGINFLPTVFFASCSTIAGNLAVNGTRPHLSFLDNDTLADVLYFGTFPVPDTTRPMSGLAVAEYEPGQPNFRRVWSRVLRFTHGGLASGDFDSDGRKDFTSSMVAGSLIGITMVFENVGDNAFDLVWQDSIPLANFYYGTAGDVDHDGKAELFRGATMSDGNWTVVYESDSNNHYVAKVLFHFIAGGTFDEPTYLTTDVDGDGRLEFALKSGRHIFIFKSTSNDTYILWYYKREDRATQIAISDLDHRGYLDIIVSKISGSDSLGRLRYYSDIYLANTTLGIISDPGTPSNFVLFQNYPNPFNPITTIEYELRERSQVRLTVYDVSGRLVRVLHQGEQSAGKFKVRWDGTNQMGHDVASGVYLYVLLANQRHATKKMLLTR